MGFAKSSTLVELFDHGPDLAACETMLRNFGKQGNCIQLGGRSVCFAVRHYGTQQLTTEAHPLRFVLSKWSYQNTHCLSRDPDIRAPLSAEIITRNLHGIATLHALEQGLSKPMRLLATDPKRVAEDTRLMSAAWMRRFQAIVVELAEIEDSVLAVWQA